MNTRWKIAQYFEAWWWKKYLLKKPVEEYLNWKVTYWKKFFFQEKIEVLPTDKILDAGCGPAGVFMMFSENKVMAIDPLLETYEKKIPHFKKERYAHVCFKKTTLEQFDLKNHFEKVFCLNVINHVSDLETSIKNLCDSLKQKGTIYLSVDAHNYFFLRKIFRFIPGDILHPHQLDLEEYKLLLIKNGIKIKNISLIKKEFVFNYYLITGQKNK